MRNLVYVMKNIFFFFFLKIKKKIKFWKFKKTQNTYGQQSEKYDTEATYISVFAVVRDSLDNFGRSVMWRAAARFRDIRSHPPREAKISDFYVVELVEEDVFGLQVPVAYRVLVQVLEGVDHLVEEVHPEIKGKWPPLDEEVEKFAILRVLEDNVEVAGALREFFEF